MEKQSISGRKRARKLALQALYQWHMSGHELSEIEIQFRVANNMEKVDVEHFCKLLYGIPKHLSSLDKKFTPLLDRPFQDLDPVELTVLRLGSFELLYCPEIPYRVVLDECIALVRTFGFHEGHKYVNGVLNNLAQEVRAIEVQSQK